MLRSLSIGIFLASAIHIMGADLTSLTAIGLVRASGEFTIDGSSTRDNSTVFHGSVISTTNAASHVVLEDGTRIDMGVDSRGQIYRDHLAIEQGLAQVNTSNRYAVIVGKIRIDSPQRTLVRVLDSSTVAVTALQGVTEVKNGKGILVAMVPPGMTFEFRQAQMASAAGCLERIQSTSGGQTTVHYLLQDQTTNMVVELVGTGLEPLVGIIVQATGPIDPNATPTPPAAKVIDVANLNSASQEKCTGPIGAKLPPAAPSAPAGAPGAAPPAAAGLPLAAKVGIIAGVAVGGTMIGLCAAGVICGGGARTTSPSPASR